ncbi:MAG: site-2 protease family protein [Victivallales bacterium]|nr:site-2 protease family protein [Victivallales bacterium]
MTYLANFGIILFTVFFFGFCIFIHEFGHLLAAVWQKLVVEKFSIGFGKKIWGFKKGGIEYVISWLPFGGFVSIPQLDTAETTKAADGRELPHGAPKARAITAFAGPFFNILFGFVLATIMWGVGVWKTPPASSCIVTEVPKILPLYKDGLKEDDKIIAVNGVAYDKSLEDLLYDWENLQESLHLPKLEQLEPITMTIRDTKGRERNITYTPQPGLEWQAGLRPGDRIVKVNEKPLQNGYNQLYELHAYNGLPQATVTVVRPDVKEPFDIAYEQLPNPSYEGLGVPFYFARNPIAINGVIENSPAAAAGFKSGDQLLAVCGRTVTSTRTVFEILAEDNSIQQADFLIARHDKEMTLTVQLPEERNAKSLGFIFTVVIQNVFMDSPAEAAGILPKDRIIKLNDLEITEASAFIERVKESKGAPLTIVVEREGKELTFENICAREAGDRYLIGVQLDDTQPKVIVHLSPWKQFTDVLGQTAKTLSLLFKPITSKISGTKTSKSQVKVKHMSGVVGITALLWGTLKNEGLRGGMSLIILITFSLAFVNLLPFPVLDGGHILFAFIEMLIRRPLPVKLVTWLQNIFAGLLIALMIYITFNDVLRLPKFIKAFQKNAPPSMELLEKEESTP